MQRRGCACFTIVRDEPVFLAIWHRHYASAFSNANLHLLHHVTEADEVAVGPFAGAIALFEASNVTRLVNADFDPQWLGDVVAAKLRSLLDTHTAVLFAEADELLTPDASGSGGLAAYVDAFVADSAAHAVRCVGYELHHDSFAGEPPLDAARPILAQRRRWHRNTLYDKVLLTKMPLTWSLGFHTCKEATPQDMRLLLLHLHKYDFQAYLQRHEARAKYKHSQAAIANGWNTHYRVEGAALIAQYMALPAPLEDIPAWVCDALPGI